MAKDLRSLDDLTPDAQNANRGTERGIYMVENSLEQYGAGRSILVDAEGRVIAGNKTLAAAVEKGFPVQVVRTDGKALVVVQREDLDLSNGDERARLLAYADNRSSEVGLDWSPEQLLADLDAGLDLEGMFRDWEMDLILGKVGEEDFDPEREWQGMPEFEQPDIQSFHSIVVHFANLEAISAFAKLVGRTVTDRTKSIQYPPKPNEDKRSYVVIDES